MNTFLTSMHSGLRWIVLLLLIYSIANAIIRRNTYEKKDRLLYMFTMVSMHIQLLIGLVLYFFISGKVTFHPGWITAAQHRFYGMEHLVGMILAIALVTIGHIASKKQIESSTKHKRILVWYSIGLILVLAFIPWPFRTVLGGHWY
ncbi:MAG: cytochrome B [Bacteroidetes bacterium]|nr:cytochrome B [Bacteroidota bacterium]